MNRRQLLATFGLGSVAAGLPLEMSWALAPPPRRLLILLNKQGCVPWRWRCDPYQRGDVDQVDDWTGWTEAAFSDSLRPLHRWRHRITAVDGLGLVSAVAEGREQQHALSTSHILTGAPTLWYTGRLLSSGPSVDQLVADDIALPERLHSLETAILGSWSAHPVYAAPYAMVAPARGPLETWDRVFGSTLAIERRDVFELVQDRFRTVASSLPSAERQRMHQHRELLDEMLVRVAELEEVQCDSAPDEPGGLPHDLRAHLDAQMAVVVPALACDLVRVVTIEMGEVPLSELRPGENDANLHFHYAHGIYTNLDAEQVMTEYTARYAEGFGRVLDALDSVWDGDGTLLDNTLVVWMSELADSTHAKDRYPVVLAGGRNSGIELGRYVRYAPRSTVDSGVPGDRRVMGVPHNRLLVTLCKAMGLDVDSVGRRSVPSWNGPDLDLTGALPELLP